MPATAPAAYKKRFLIRRGKHLYSIATEHIGCLVLEDRYVTMVTVEGKEYTLTESLERLESQLAPNDFFRINRHTIVSYSTIGHIEPWFNNRLRIHPVTEWAC